MNKSFTLIELLVVVAIIGILAAVGIPIFQGFLTTAKINATTEQHNRMASLLKTYVTQCNSGASTIKLKINSRWPIQDISCNTGKNNKGPPLYEVIGRHFGNTGLGTNPYTKIMDGPLGRSGCGNLGQTFIKKETSYTTQPPMKLITITTNVGTEDGKNKCIKSSAIVE